MIIFFFATFFVSLKKKGKPFKKKNPTLKKKKIKKEQITSILFE
jgi:hypothetical protein